MHAVGRLSDFTRVSQTRPVSAFWVDNELLSFQVTAMWTVEIQSACEDWHNDVEDRPEKAH